MAGSIALERCTPQELEVDRDGASGTRLCERPAHRSHPPSWSAMCSLEAANRVAMLIAALATKIVDLQAFPNSEIKRALLWAPEICGR